MIHWAVEVHPDDKSAHIDVRAYNDKGELEGEMCLDFKYTHKNGITQKSSKS